MAIEIRDYQPADRSGVVALARELQAAEAVLYDRSKPPEEIGDWYLDMLLKDCTEHGGKIIIARTRIIVRGDIDPRFKRDEYRNKPKPPPLLRPGLRWRVEQLEEVVVEEAEEAREEAAV